MTVRTIHSPAMHGSVAGTRPGLCTQHARPVTHAPGMGVRRQRAARTYVFARMQPAFASRPSLRPSSAALRARPAVCNAWFNQGKGTDERLAEIAVAQQDGEQLESLQLPREVRDRVSDAVEDLGGQVTVGDVSARAGVTPFEAEQGLQALAADAQGTLQVSNEGDVLYVLPKGFRGTIAARSWRLRAEPVLKKAVGAVNYLTRIAFGTALVTSVAVVWLAIIAILSSANNDRDNRRSNSSYGGGGFNAFISPTDLFFFTDPYYMRRRRYMYSGAVQVQQPEPRMNFVEAIFSFVFGDGDPNVQWEERRWQTLGRIIAAKGGVVTAEEMAPYLDLPEGGAQPEDEGYVVPALLKFSGHPEVDDNGNLLYVFPDLQKTGGAAESHGVAERLLTKEEWRQTDADGGQRTGTIALGAANLVGVAWLSSLLRDASIKYALANSSLGFVAGAMPFLQAYAVGFFAIPLVRWLRNKARNAKIEAQNADRRQAAAKLGAPRPALAAKLDAARKLGRSSQRVISERDIAYRSDRNLADQQPASGQPGGLDWEMEDFDKRLKQQSRDETRDFDKWQKQQSRDKTRG